MEYIAKKTFERNGVLYQNGDVMPELDSATVAHYSHYGMIAPAETKPEEPNGPSGENQTAGTEPQETKPSGPKEPGKKGQNKKGAADAAGADQSVADGTSVSETEVNQG